MFTLAVIFSSSLRIFCVVVAAVESSANAIAAFHYRVMRGDFVFFEPFSSYYLATLGCGGGESHMCSVLIIDSQ